MRQKKSVEILMSTIVKLILVGLVIIVVSYILFNNSGSSNETIKVLTNTSNILK